MKILRFFYASILLAVSLLISIRLLHAGMIATKDGGDPTQYTQPTLEAAQQQLQNLDALKMERSNNPSALSQINVHQAAVAPEDAAPKAESSPITGVTVQGIGAGNQEILRIAGAVQNAGEVAVDCGVGLFPVGPAAVASRSATQLDVLIPPSMLDRPCTVTTAGAGSFSFTLPGLTCKTWSQLCPGAVVGSYDPPAAKKGQPTVHIEIRNGPGPLDVLTPANVDNIRRAFAMLPLNTLSRVRYIQYTPEITTYIGNAEASNDGGMYAGGSLVGSLPIFPVGYGVGSLVYDGLSETEKTFWTKNHYNNWNSAQGFATYYFDWAKSTEDFIDDYIATLDRSDMPFITSTIQKSLTMATHFYDPRTALLQIGLSQEPFTVTAEQIKFRDVIYYRSGNNIVGYSSLGRAKKFYPSPIPLPDAFLQVFHSQRGGKPSPR